MPLFDAPPDSHPERWRQLSFDSKLFFVWECSLFVAVIPANLHLFDSVSDRLYYGVPLLLLFALLFASFAYRRRENWQRPKLAIRNLFGTLLTIIAVAIFFFIWMQSLLPLTHSTAPMLLFALSMGVFSILQTLGIVQWSNVEFQRNCNVATKTTVTHVGAPAAQPPIDPLWKRILRGVWTIASAFIWCEMMVFFYFDRKFTYEGSLKPTITQTEALNVHGENVYLTHQQMIIHDWLEGIALGGLVLVVFGGACLLHYVLGVRLFSNGPASPGIFNKNS